MYYFNLLRIAICQNFGLPRRMAIPKGIGTAIRTLLLLGFVFFMVQSTSAQTNDTLTIYKKIQKIAYRHKATTFLYQAIFVDPAPKRYENKPLSDKQKTKDPDLKYQGKIIRNIEIISYDPFGYSVNDTTRKVINPLQKLGNHYHITTRKKIVKNLLLFKKNDPVDLIVINESERILRQTTYINDARIYFSRVGHSDSVDVEVVVHDKWSIDIPATGNTSGGHLTLRDRNILGLGQRYEQYIGYNVNGNYEISGRNTIGNIGNSFISSDVFYTSTNYLTTIGFALNRSFYSPLAKWAGGIAESNTIGTYQYIDPVEKTPKKLDLNYNNSDIWLAKNIHPFTGKRTNRRISNFTVALRYAQTHFESRPPFTIDQAFSNVNTNLYLGSVGFALSKFYKDQFIYRFGANEDVPEGLIVQYLYGVLFKEYTGIRYYTGFNISRGKHIENIGYFSANAAYGTFFNIRVPNNSTLNLGAMYFTDLLRSKGWYFRQFIYLKYINGINKTPAEKITLRQDELYGFISGGLAGKSKVVVNLEGIIYSPYNLIGFRFAPVINAGFGMLETDQVKLFQGHVYQAYSIGLLIRNENLITNSFKITCGIYPYLPDGSRQNFKLNPSISFTLKVQSFLFSKPTIVVYD
jgi:hypothetical protein